MNGHYFFLTGAPLSTFYVFFFHFLLVSFNFFFSFSSFPFFFPLHFFFPFFLLFFFFLSLFLFSFFLFFFSQGPSPFCMGVTPPLPAPGSVWLLYFISYSISILNIVIHYSTPFFNQNKPYLLLSSPFLYGQRPQTADVL